MSGSGAANLDHGGQPHAAGGAIPAGTTEASSGVRSLIKSLSILDALGSENSLTAAEIARRVGLNRTTTYRILQTLVGRSYVRATPGNGYAIGPKVLPIAAQQLDNNRVRLAALPQLSLLAKRIGERVNLGVLFDTALLYIAGIEKPSLPNIYSRFGHRAPLHCCSLGKAIVAFSESETLERLLAGPLERHTANTIIDPEILRTDMLETRQRGYAIDRGEHLPGTFCVAAPILDARQRPVAAIGISSNDLEKALNNIKEVRVSAEIIGHVLAAEVVR
jgi:DNA-binding IclR family transcriptional regulator